MSHDFAELIMTSRSTIEWGPTVYLPMPCCQFEIKYRFLKFDAHINIAQTVGSKFKKVMSFTIGIFDHAYGHQYCAHLPSIFFNVHHNLKQSYHSCQCIKVTFHLLSMRFLIDQNQSSFKFSRKNQPNFSIFSEIFIYSNWIKRGFFFRPFAVIKHAKENPSRRNRIWTESHQPTSTDLKSLVFYLFIKQNWFK